jgi:hypothetical protein
MGAIKNILGHKVFRQMATSAPSVYRFFSLVLLSVLLFGGLPLQAQSPDTTAASLSVILKTYLSHQTIPRDRILKYEVEITWRGEISRLQIVQIPEPHLENLVLESSGSASRQENLPDGTLRSTKSIMYELKPLAPGKGLIDGMTLLYRDTRSGAVDEIRTLPQTVTITEAATTPKLSSKMYLFLLLMFGLTFGYFLITFLRKRFAARRTADTTDTSPAALCLQRLHNEIDPKGLNLTDSALRMWHIIHAYFSQRWPQASATTANEWLEWLRNSDLTEEDLKKLEPFLRKIDMIKFGGDTMDPLSFSEFYESVTEFVARQQNQPTRNI